MWQGKQNPGVTVILGVHSSIPTIQEVAHSIKITRSPEYYVVFASSQTAALLKWMLRSEPNSIKEKAISKSKFYYIATCLTSLNLLLFVGTNTVGNDLQQS